MNEVATPIILASASPRRRELLSQIAVRYEVLPVDVDETPRAGEVPELYAERIALAKAQAAAAIAGGDRPVLGADTSVVLGEQILGKPRDRAEGLAMLRSLSAATHRVLSAVALVWSGRQALRLCVSRVRFRSLSDAEIQAYWASGEPADKAGAYAIQGLGAVFVEHLEGSYSGVMGLPLYETAALLRECGIETLNIADPPS